MKGNGDIINFLDSKWNPYLQCLLVLFVSLNIFFGHISAAGPPNRLSCITN